MALNALDTCLGSLLPRSAARKLEGIRVVALARSLDEGLSQWQAWRDHKLKLHNASITLLAMGPFGLMVVLTLALVIYYPNTLYEPQRGAPESQ